MKDQNSNQNNGDQTQTITEQAKQIQSQQKAIQHMQEQIDAGHFELPILKITNKIIMVPLVGTMDSVKCHKVMEDLLYKIKEQESRVIVIDIAGINVVDSSVAAHLVKIAKSTRLMGCHCIISGISPIIASNIVNLGVDTSDFQTTNTLEDAISQAYKYTGLELSLIS